MGILNIRIEGPDAHVEGVGLLLGQIMSNMVGAAIIRAIAATGKDLLIEPYNQRMMEDEGVCNSVTKPQKGIDNVRAASPGGLMGGQPGAPWYKGNLDIPRRGMSRHDQHSYKIGRSTGKGADVQMYYSPDLFATKVGGEGCSKGAFGSLADEILLHELVHALRFMQGRVNPIPTEDHLKRYTTHEEFLAIVVANVYISAKPSLQLRADHHGHARLRDSLSTSAGFLSDPGNLHLMNIYNLVWRPTFQDLARVGWDTFPAFNPFRELANRLAHLQSSDDDPW